MHFENEWYGLFARICLFQENWDWNCADLIQADLTWHVHNIVHNEYAHFSLKSDVTCKHEIYQVKLWQKMWFINLTRERKYKHGRKYKATQEQKDIDDELILMCLLLALLETDHMAQLLMLRASSRLMCLLLDWPHVDGQLDRDIEYEEVFQPSGHCFGLFLVSCFSRLACSWDPCQIFDIFQTGNMETGEALAQHRYTSSGSIALRLA